MKKLIYLIPLLFISNLFADTRTSGQVNLLLPTTGAVDNTRSWADKYNADFKIISSTLDRVYSELTNINSSTATSTVDINGLKLFRTTAQAEIDEFNAFITTAGVTANNTNYIFNQPTLQTGASFYVKVGSATNFYAANYFNGNLQTNGMYILGNGGSGNAGKISSSNGDLIIQGSFQDFVMRSNPANNDTWLAIGANNLGGAGEWSPTTLVDINGGSLTIRGSNAGIDCQGEIKTSSITSYGTINSSTGYKGNSSTITYMESTEIKTSTLTIVGGSVTIQGVNLLYPTITPTDIDMTLTYKGNGQLTWKKPIGTVSGGIAKTLYLYEALDAGINNLYEQIWSTPSTSAESGEHISVTAGGGRVIISSHDILISDFQNGLTTLPSGEWVFVFYSSVNSPTGITSINVTVSTMDKAGNNITEILSSTGSDINNVGLWAEFTDSFILQTPVVVTSDTRLLLNVYAFTDSVAAKTVSIAYQGQAHASFLRTTVSNASVFTALQDCPSTYAGQAGKIPSVKSTENGLEFITNSGAGLLSSTPTFTTPVTIPSATFQGLVYISSLNIVGTVTSTSGFVGEGKDLLRISSIAHATVGTNQLSATGISASKYLKGDNTWDTPAGGGGTLVIQDTKTVHLQAGGDIYVATNAFVAIPGCSWTNNRVDTITLTAAEMFMTRTSTCSDTVFAVRVGTSSNIHETLYTSSFTMPMAIGLNNNADFPRTVFSPAINLYPKQTLTLWVQQTASSGTLPGGTYGINLEGWKLPRP